MRSVAAVVPGVVALSLVAAAGIDTSQSADAAELNARPLNIRGVSDYASSLSPNSLEQVTSITQFSDVYPTDWAYQALSNLIERYGCVAGYPNGTYRGNRAMTRFEAAALLNACLDRVTEVTDELKRLIKEFEKELAILKGRVDGLEAKVGELEATQFSTTTKLKGQTTFITGAVNASGDNGSKVLPNGATRDASSFSGNGLNGGAKAYNQEYGAFTFNYDQRLYFETSFTGKDLLLAYLRAGNFGSNNALNGGGINLTQLDVAYDSSSGTGSSNVLNIYRLWYRFPVGDQFTVIAGAIARNTEMLAMWPSVYNKGGVKTLEVFSLGGATGVYNKATGQMIGGYWKQATSKGDPAWSVSVNYVAAEGNTSDPNSGGIMTDRSEGNLTAQLGYSGPRFGAALAYRYGQCGTGFRHATEFVAANGYNNSCTATLANGASEPIASSTNSYAVNAYWQPQNSGWVPSVSLGWGYNQVSAANKLPASPLNSQSWFTGIKWSDVGLKGNDLGFAVGQPVFATGLDGGTTPFDGNYAFELYYSFQVTDNIQVAPSVFYLSRPMGQFTSNLTRQGSGYDGNFSLFGGVIQTTFKF
jgi:hypothetical protein